MNLSVDTVITLAVYLVTLAGMAGAVLTRISNLEKKVEKHNNLIERMYKVEESAKQAHFRIDELKEEIG